MTNTHTLTAKEVLIRQINRELLNPVPYITNINWDTWLYRKELTQGLNALFEIFNPPREDYEFIYSENKINFLLFVLEAIEDGSFFE